MLLKYPLDEEAANREVENFKARYRHQSVKVELVWMRPEEFLKQCPLSGNIHVAALRGLHLTQHWSESSISYLTTQIYAGRKLDPLYLDYNNMFLGWPSHEGRHRAWVAINLGIEKVPVIVIKPTGWIKHNG